MSYTSEMQAAIAAGPNNLGNMLGRFAVKREVSVLRVAAATGATRQTVYRWFVGGTVSRAYKKRVQRVRDILIESDSADAAWRTMCLEFSLAP